jgi:hypothetical protein
MRRRQTGLAAVFGLAVVTTVINVHTNRGSDNETGKKQRPILNFAPGGKL